MWITVSGENSTEVEEAVITRVLSMYPEEELATRKFFQNAFKTGGMEFRELKKEGDKILIPWQMFFLSSTNLQAQLAHIDRQRKHKVSRKLLAKRRGSGNVTAKRIVDRLIRNQNFLIDSIRPGINEFCGSLKGLHIEKAAQRILDYFEIDRAWMWKISGKARALEHLIDKIESKNINVSRGVVTHKILPSTRVVPSSVYKNTSGFAIKDDRFPFIFLPGEINPDEVEGRQIYTLIYLLVVIGLDQYEYILEKDMKASMLSAGKMTRRIHSITSEFLVPESETRALLGEDISNQTRDDLSARFKVSPTALLTILRIRKILSKEQYEALLPEPFVPGRSGKIQGRLPPISSAVKKFCGTKTFETINASIRNGLLKNTQAQYLIFGAINKKGFLKYRKLLGI